MRSKETECWQASRCYVFCICEYFSPIERGWPTNPETYINEPFNQKQAHNPTDGYRYNTKYVIIKKMFVPILPTDYATAKKRRRRGETLAAHWG